MSAENLIEILKECKDMIKGRANSVDSEIAELREKVEELQLRQNRRSKLSTRVDDLIREIEREDDRLAEKLKEYEKQKEERMCSIKTELDDMHKITHKFDCFKDEVKLQKELLAQNELRKQIFHQLMLSSIAELYSDFDVIEYGS